MRDPAWVDYAWAEWVPQRERDMIESFWGTKSFGRTPADWERNAREPYNSGIAFGERVKMWDSYQRQTVVEGRYVHRWNNIGVVVTDDGEAVSVSGGRLTRASIETAAARVSASLAVARAQVGALEASASRLAAILAEVE